MTDPQGAYTPLTYVVRCVYEVAEGFIGSFDRL